MFNYSFFKTRLHLAFHLLFSLSFSKISNILRNIYALYFKNLKAGKVPSILTLQLTYNCNYSCIMCQKNSMDNNVYNSLAEMDYLNLEKYLRANSKYIAILRITGGEPLSYSDIEKLLDLLDEISIKYSIITNGSLLTERISKKLLKNCIEVSLSIDSADKEIYSFIRMGGSLIKVVENIEVLNKLKGKKRYPALNVAAACFTFNIDGLSRLVEFCHQYNIPTISASEGTFYNTPDIKEEHFIRNDLHKCHIAVNKAQKTADDLGITLRFNSPVLYFSKEDNQIISNRNRVSGCTNFFFSGIITPEFQFKICPLSIPILDMEQKSLQEIWNGPELQKCRDAILKNDFPSTCRFCPDYNEHFDEYGKEYSYIDYQKNTHYWKI